MSMFRLRNLITSAAILLASTQADAALHLMQIEQVIGGVNGDSSAQAIQLRMRFAGQSVTSQGRLIAFDAAGANPIIICDMTTNVAVGSAGSRVLIASTAFQTSPSITPDFVMTNTIPASYLAAGSLVFQDDGGTIYWRLCWGGASYTGSTLVAQFVNDDDGNVAPPVPGALNSTTLQALQFPGTAAAGSTTNLANYAVTARGATFTNNAGSSGVVIAPPPPCPADITGNGSVDVADLLTVITAWGACAGCPATPCGPDVAPLPDGDCAVNVADLLLVISSWGACS